MLQPLVYGRTVQLSPLIVLVAVLIGAELAGVIGALGAIPVAGIIQAIVREVDPRPLRGRLHRSAERVLPESTRLLILKDDGSVLVHADAGGYKPLNWMTPPTVIEEDGDVGIVVRKRAGKTEDRLEIRHRSRC